MSQVSNWLQGFAKNYADQHFSELLAQYLRNSEITPARYLLQEVESGGLREEILMADSFPIEQAIRELLPTVIPTASPNKQQEKELLLAILHKQFARDFGHSSLELVNHELSEVKREIGQYLQLTIDATPGDANFEGDIDFRLADDMLGTDENSLQTAVNKFAQLTTLKDLIIDLIYNRTK